jgi:glutathione S-transferase
MKLRWSPTSPYTRKVLVTAIETGQDKLIDRVLTLPASAPDLPKENPLGKIPTLILEDGSSLVDSPVIVEYLDSRHSGEKIVPPTGPARWKALKLQALADGILDAAVLRLYEIRRPDQFRFADWIAKQKTVVARTLDLFEGEAKGFDQKMTVGQMAVAVALDYLDFRFKDDDWRKGRPNLTAWHGKFGERPSLKATMPKEPS